MAAIEYIAFSAFVEQLKSLVAPESLGEELEDYFREQIANALADIQTLIPWTRQFNVSIYTKINVDEFCATSVFEGPLGKITQMFAYKPGRDCKKLHYQRVSTAKIDCWIETQRCVQCELDPVPTNIYDTPYCNYVVAGESACNVPYLSGEEDDCRFLSLSADQRIFAVGPDYKVYAAPRFPCGYYLLVQWQGVKRKWEDTDLVMVDQQMREAIINRVEMKIAMKEREFTAAHEYEAQYIVMLRTLKYRYFDEQDVELERDCSAAIERLLPAMTPLYPTSSDPTVIAILTEDGQPILAEQ